MVKLELRPQFDIQIRFIVILIHNILIISICIKRHQHEDWSSVVVFSSLGVFIRFDILGTYEDAAMFYLGSNWLQRNDPDDQNMVSGAVNKRQFMEEQSNYKKDTEQMDIRGARNITDFDGRRISWTIFT